MAVYYVKYRWSEDEWRVDNTFSDYDSAEAYVESQVTQAQAGLAGSLNGYGYDDFVVTTSPRITYSTNWMGPINHDWIAENGVEWSAGRIDVYGTGDHYAHELVLPAMVSEDWNRFSRWLETFSTNRICTLKEIVREYEKTQPKITWFNTKEGE